jgi:hypothetical protein
MAAGEDRDLDGRSVVERPTPDSDALRRDGLLLAPLVSFPLPSACGTSCWAASTSRPRPGRTGVDASPSPAQRSLASEPPRWPPLITVRRCRGAPRRQQFLAD